MHTGTSHNQVTDTRKTSECFRFAAHGNAQTLHFRNASCHESRFAVVPKAQTVVHACCQCHNVFQSCAHFHANDICAGVNAEFGIHEFFLHHFCHFFIFRSNEACGGDFSCHFFRMAGTGQYANFALRHAFLNDLRKTQQTAVLQTFCHIDDDSAGFEIRRKICHGLAHCTGRHRRNDDFRTLQHRFTVCGGCQCFRQCNAGKIFFVGVFAIDFVYSCLTSCPNLHLMVILGQNDGKGCAPAAGTDYRYIFHNKLPFLRLSLSK